MNGLLEAGYMSIELDTLLLEAEKLSASMDRDCCEDYLDRQAVTFTEGTVDGVVSLVAYDRHGDRYPDLKGSGPAVELDRLAMLRLLVARVFVVAVRGEL